MTPKTATPHETGENAIEPRGKSPTAAASGSAAPASGIDEAVERIAARHAVPPQLIHSVIKVESNYNPLAVSPKGALGLMQLIPSTARRFGVSDVFNPVQNIEGGTKYLKYLLDLYDNHLGLALAAYNAGENAVARYGAVPPYRETRDYVRLVATQLQVENARRKEKETAAQPAENNISPGPHHIREVVEPDGTVRYVTR